MMDNGYIFAIDNKRIFLNTSLGCNGKCSYCYLPKMGYSNQVKTNNTKTAEEILKMLKESTLDINQDTLITIGCYSECLDDANKKETLHLVKYFLKKGNQVQLATKRQILENDLMEIVPLVKYYGQFVIFISAATISKQSELEKNTTPILERLKSFSLSQVSPIPIVLYIKPVLKGITIQDLELYKHYIEKYRIKDVVIGSEFTDDSSGEDIHFSNKKELFYTKNSDEDILFSELGRQAKVYRRSSEVMKNYKR